MNCAIPTKIKKQKINFQSTSVKRVLKPTRLPENVQKQEQQKMEDLLSTLSLDHRKALENRLRKADQNKEKNS